MLQTLFPTIVGAPLWLAACTSVLVRAGASTQDSSEVRYPGLWVGKNGLRFELLVDRRSREHLGGVGPGAETLDAAFEVFPFFVWGLDQVPRGVKPSAADFVVEPLVLLHTGEVQLEVLAGELVVGVDPGKAGRGGAGAGLCPVDQDNFSP